GARPRGAWVGPGPAVDPGPGRRRDRAAVPSPVHAARGVVLAAPDRVQPAGAGAPGRRAGRGGDRGLAGADLGEGMRLAAATGAGDCFGDETGPGPRPPQGGTPGPPGATPRGRGRGKSSGRG